MPVSGPGIQDPGFFSKGAASARFAAQSGAGLGTAKGAIVIDTSALGKAVNDSQQAARGIQSAFTSVDRSAKATEASVGHLQRGLQASARGLTAFSNQAAQAFDRFAKSSAVLSAAGGLLTGFGVAQAGRLQRVNMLMELFSKDTAQAEQRLNSIRQIAEQTDRPFIDIAEAAIGVLPAVTRANVSLEDTLSIIQRLAVLDPLQGVSGASYAIRELLSGSVISLAGRFEAFSRQEINALLSSAGGDQQKIIDGLGAMIDQMGLTQDKFQEMSTSGALAFENLKGTVQTALGEAFTPLLVDVLQPGAQALANWTNQLRTQNPELLKWGSGLVVAVAALAPVSFILSKITAAFGVMIGVISSPIFLTVLTALGALAGGVALGTALAQGLANNGIGDPRLRSDSGENPFAVLWERFKQAIVVVVTTLAQFGADLRYHFELFGVQWQLLGDKLRLRFETTLLRLLSDIMGIFEWFYSTFSFLDTSGVAANIRQGRQGIADAVTDRENQAGLLDLAEQFITQALQKARALAYQEIADNVSAPLVNTLFPPATKGVVEMRTKELAEELSFVQRVLGPFGDALRGGVEAAREFAAEQRELAREWAREAQRLAEDRALEDSRQTADYGLSDFRARRDFNRQLNRSDTDFWRGIQKATESFNVNIQSSEAEALAARAKANADFQEEEANRYDDHQRRMAEIQKNTLDSVMEAAFRLDATGVWKALKQGADQSTAESDRYTRERAEREKEFARQVEETKQAFAEQRDVRVKAFAEQQADQIAQYQLQRDRQLEDNALRLADEVEDRRIRFEREYQDRKIADDRAESDRQLRLFRLAYDLSTEAGMWEGLKNAVINAGNEIRPVIDSIFQTIRNNAYQDYRSGERVDYTTPPPPTSPIVPLPPPGNYWRDGIFYPASAGGRGIPQYATGGLAHGWALVGERGPELANFTQPARVYDADSTRKMLGGGGPRVVIENFAPQFGDVGRHSEARIASIVEDTLYRVLAEVELRL